MDRQIIQWKITDGPEIYLHIHNPLICGKDVIAEQWESTAFLIYHAGWVVMHIKNLWPYPHKSIQGGLYI